MINVSILGENAAPSDENVKVIMNIKIVILLPKLKKKKKNRLKSVKCPIVNKFT